MRYSNVDYEIDPFHEICKLHIARSTNILVGKMKEHCTVLNVHLPSALFYGVCQPIGSSVRMHG